MDKDKSVKTSEASDPLSTLQQLVIDLYEKRKNREQIFNELANKINPSTIQDIPSDRKDKPFIQAVYYSLSRLNEGSNSATTDNEIRYYYECLQGNENYSSERLAEYLKYETIYCAYQEVLSMSSFDNTSIPHVHDATLHRLEISEGRSFFGGREDESSLYPNLLSKLCLGINWIIFTSTKTEQSSDNVITLGLRIRRMIDLFGLYYSSLSAFGIDGLYYIVTDNLTNLGNVNNSALWTTGAGLALPLEPCDPERVRQAIHLQLTIRNNLIPYIKILFKCAILPVHDSNGVEIIWADDWEHSDVMKRWALKLVEEYPIPEELQPYRFH
jgi:hypothetical protein